MTAEGRSQAPAPGAATLRARGASRIRPVTTAVTTPGMRRFVALVLHLAKREMDSTHRTTTLGWLWPLARQLAQLAVLVFVFSNVLDLGIENFPVYVLTGLVAWNWFSSGMSSATSSVLNHSHFLMQPRFPALALPVVSVAVPFIDLLLALPVLAVLLIFSGDLSWTVVILPAIALVQFLLTVGLGWLGAAATVFFRDVPNVVGVVLTLMFYLTPVFYGLRSVPEEFRWLLHLNPLTTLLEAYRAVLLGDPWPGAGRLAIVTVIAVAMAPLGAYVFRRVQKRFADYL